MVCRWAQELLSYHFTVVHRSNRMMIDVDALTRWYGSLITTHCVVASILHLRDRNHRPTAYDMDIFLSTQSSKLTSPEVPFTSTPILSSTFMTSSQIPTVESYPVTITLPTISISTILFLSATNIFVNTTLALLPDSEM